MSKDQQLIPSSMPDLSEYEPASMELSPDYWTPQEVGEVRLLVYAGVELRMMPDADNPDKHVELPCAIFYEKFGSTVKSVANASKRLLGVFESESPGQAYRITYLGKKKNSSNQNASDSWSVIRLQPPKRKETP